MLLTILAFVASLVPSVLIFVFLRKRHGNDKSKTENKPQDTTAQNNNEVRDDEPLPVPDEARDREPSPVLTGLRAKPPSNALTYRKHCLSALLTGMLCTVPILVLSGILYILNNVLRATLLEGTSVLLYKAIYTFIVLALAEEIVKFFAFKLFLKKRPFAYTPEDMVAIMVILGTGFGLLESVVYAIGATPVIMLVRGVTVGHVGYGFLMGLFYSKRIQTGKKGYGFLAVLIPWLIHGLYDFSLSPELIEINDNFAFLGVSLAILDIVLLIFMIRYFVKTKKEKAEVIS